MLLLEKVSLAACAAVLALGLVAAVPASAQTPPPVPGAGGAGPADDDLPPPVSRRGNGGGQTPETGNGGPPPVTRTDVPPPPPLPPQMEFYVLVAGAQQGPLDEAALAEMAKAGKLTKQTQVWQKGMAGWDVAGNVPDLAALIEANAPVVAPPPPPPPQPDFYAIVNGQQVGPIPGGQLAAMIQAGQITASTMVWTKGMADWKPAGEVPELAALLQPAGGARTGTNAGGPVKVRSFCGATGKEGIGEGPTLEIAKDKAIKACIANGGLPRCCPNSITVLSQ